MIADDLFAGAGGWDLAAAKLGIHARGIENMKEARGTRDTVGLTTIHDDVWTYRPDGKADGLIASPPCQTFSTSGKGSGRAALDDVLRGIWSQAFRSKRALIDLGEKVGDRRTALVLAPLHFATQYEYEWLAWEQVPAVLPVWQACSEVLADLGWSTWTGYLHAEQYGVPQTRKRAFLLASRNHSVAPPLPTHSRYYSRDPGRLDMGVQKWVSMAEAFGWDSTTGHLRGNQLPEGGRSRVDEQGYILRPISEPAITVTGNTRSYRWADLPDWAFTRPSTVVQGDPRIAAPGHRCMTSDCHQGRQPESMMARATRVTIEQAAVLQAFPADYAWQGGKCKQFLQCGNAVPPMLAASALASVTPSAIEAVA